MSVFDPSKPVLVFLAAGVQGGAVVRAALARGLKVRALVRDRARAAALAAPGVELAEGDLRDVASLRAACVGIERAVLQVPIGAPEAMRDGARNALAAFAATGVRAFALKLASASRPPPCAEPSFVGNDAVEAEARRSALPFAVVRPTLYLDNLLKPSARADIVRHGVFAPPLPSAQRVAWTCADDCARAALMLLERGAFGGDHRIAGPHSLSGEEFAACVSRGLGRTIRYRAQPLDEFERDIDAALGAGVGRRVGSKFRYFAGHREETETILAAPFAAQRGLEGFAPTGVEAWANAHRGEFDRDANAAG
ncbi:NmrA family NAD(P)-binding protein [Lysobacter sp. K5869]|uniref:NmrA family NAD(P)-binding protein n=1 Tax=Lysobacter sp. K5869 TaxID=2820808 RepID=UPI001C05F59C|nr:NmrA family NAD(P)-binding protein [Lysobacter sp. K5869]QWP78969.1 NmrA family NAD(P)-binding protein [Lysobacter sp. K5869]